MIMVWSPMHIPDWMVVFGPYSQSSVITGRGHEVQRREGGKVSDGGEMAVL